MDRIVDMFIGEYNHSLDEKGRISVPARFRSALKEGAVVTRGLDKCLFLYAKAEWEKMAERVAGLPLSQANSRAFARSMLAGAMDATPDNQGRIMVPEYLRTFAGLKKNAIIAGVGGRLEIWDRDEWESYNRSTERALGDIAEHLGEMGV